MTKFKVGDKVTIKTNINDQYIGRFNGISALIIHKQSTSSYLSGGYVLKVFGSHSLNLERCPVLWSELYLVKYSPPKYRIV